MTGIYKLSGFINLDMCRRIKKDQSHVGRERKGKRERVRGRERENERGK